MKRSSTFKACKARMKSIFTLFAKRERIEARYQESERGDAFDETAYNKAVDKLFDSLSTYHLGASFRGGWIQPDGKMIDPEEFQIIVSRAPDLNVRIYGRWDPDSPLALRLQAKDDSSWHDFTSQLTDNERIAITWFTECVLDDAVDD